MRAASAGVITLALLLVTSATLLSLPLGTASTQSSTSGRALANSRAETKVAATVTYVVTFTESGLPSGTIWSVSLNETTRSSVSSTITFEEPNGSYRLYTWDLKGYESYANVSTLHVSGTPTAIVIQYIPPAIGTYYVTFVQTGLPLSVNWAVQLPRMGDGGNGPTHTIAQGNYGVLNGTSTWSAFHPHVPEWPIPAYSPFPSTGRVVVNGSSLLIHLTYRYSYPFYFDVQGISTGVPFTLPIPNETVNGSGSGTYLLMVPNGTYAWNATAPGYRAQSGSVTVLGGEGSDVQDIHMRALPRTSTFPSWDWGALGVMVAAIVVGLVLLLRRRRRKLLSPPPPPAG